MFPGRNCSNLLKLKFKHKGSRSDFGTDPDPRIHTSDLRIRIRLLLFSSVTFKIAKTRNYFFTVLSFFAYDFLKLHLHHFSNIKGQKEVTKQEEWRFSYYFCLMIERSGARAVPYLVWIRIREAQRHSDPIPNTGTVLSDTYLLAQTKNSSNSLFLSNCHLEACLLKEKKKCVHIFNGPAKESNKLKSFAG
jgi:hypothetical protein